MLRTITRLSFELQRSRLVQIDQRDEIQLIRTSRAPIQYVHKNNPHQTTGIRFGLIRDGQFGQFGRTADSGNSGGRQIRALLGAPEKSLGRPGEALSGAPEMLSWAAQKSSLGRSWKALLGLPEKLSWAAQKSSLGQPRQLTGSQFWPPGCKSWTCPRSRPSQCGHSGKARIPEFQSRIREASPHPK